MNKKGMSLLEIIVATCILVAAMVPLWGLMGSSHKQVTISADEIRASQIAMEILEQIENSGWNPDAAAYTSPISFTPQPNSKVMIIPKEKIEVQFGNYPDYLKLKGKIEVEAYSEDDKEIGKVIRVEVLFSPKEKVGKAQKSYLASTFIAKN
jgi:type II secretory pathway pseudopilin PulG